MKTGNICYAQSLRVAMATRRLRAVHMTGGPTPFPSDRGEPIKKQYLSSLMCGESVITKPTADKFAAYFNLTQAEFADMGETYAEA